MNAKKGLLAAGFVLQGFGIYGVLVALRNAMGWPLVGRNWLGAQLGYPVGVPPEVLSNISSDLVWALLFIILAVAVFAAFSVLHLRTKPSKSL